MDEEIALLNYIAAVYVDAGYYTTDSKKLDHLARILPRLPTELVEHILGFSFKRVSAKPIRITPIKFREYELIFFVGKKWRQKLVGKYSQYTLAPIPLLFFDKFFTEIDKRAGERAINQRPLITRFGSLRTGGPQYVPYVAPPPPVQLSDDESDHEVGDEADIVQFTDEE